jgi:asparagine synthase (glutamine-hydrolysing)
LSGIGAVFYKNGRPISRSEIGKLAQGLRPFGRSYQAIKCLGSCGLAYAHFANTPQSAADRQPVSDSAGLLHLVFDGRLDNRDELANALRLTTTEAQTWPDSLFALKSWEKWDKHAPQHWEGEFAVLVWNAGSQTLTAVRDQLGDRTLSFHETNDRIVIASAPFAMFALGYIPKEIDEQKLADTLVQLFYDLSRSFYKGIARLKPGHLLTASQNGIQIERYWSIDRVADIRLASDSAYVDAATELLDRAIKGCLRRAGAVGAFISGGLDSSTVAVSTLPHLNDQERLPTFTWIPNKGWDGRCTPGSYGDETPYVNAIATMHPRLDPTFVRSDDHGLFYHLDEFLDYSGVAPRNAINLCWFHDIHLAAQARNLSVLMGGNAGNVSLGWEGQGALLEHLRDGSIGRLFAELFAGRPTSQVFIRRLLKMVLLPIAPSWVNAAYLRVRGHTSSLPLWHKFSAINPDYAQTMNVDERLSFYKHDYFQTPSRDPQKLRRFLASELYNCDKAEVYQAFRALYGIEIRDPLLNLRLTEWCAGVPEQQFWRAGEDRWLVKRLMQGKLPRKVLFKRKKGLQAIDWHHRMTQDLPQIREELEAIADDPDTSRYIDVPRIRAILNNWPSQTPLKALPGQAFFYIPVSVGSALAMGRLVRRIKGANR